MEEQHAVHAGGHYQANTIARNILHVGLWWPTLHKEF